VTLAGERDAAWSFSDRHVSEAVALFHTGPWRDRWKTARAVEIKGSYGTSGIAIRPTPHDHASALIVLRRSRRPGESHETVYNDRGRFQWAARIGLTRLPGLNATVDDEVTESPAVSLLDLLLLRCAAHPTDVVTRIVGEEGCRRRVFPAEVAVA
jgi:hypothetical protein